VLEYLLLDNGVVGTGLLWDVSTLCALVPPAGLYGCGAFLLVLLSLVELQDGGSRASLASSY
jgi:hypothetical protein